MLMLALLAAAAIEPPTCAIGVWDLIAGGQPIFRLTVRTTPAGSDTVWERPDRFTIDDAAVTRVRGGAVRRTDTIASADAAGAALRFADPRPGGSPDVWRVRCVDAGHVDAALEGGPAAPFTFVRSAGKAMMGPWDETRAYRVDLDAPSNREMTALFDADQADRRSITIDWAAVAPADRRRRERTGQLLDAGALHSGEDYWHAAFVYQHGSAANDYLKAHLLAMIAIARGRSDAVWIAAATLDRYLQVIGQPQVLGTQYRLPDGAPATQEPYDRTLASDALRAALQVPPLAEQEARRRGFDAPKASPAR